jgi:uncharacterized protein YegJ (DUF2314 family)
MNHPRANDTVNGPVKAIRLLAACFMCLAMSCSERPSDKLDRQNAKAGNSAGPSVINVEDDDAEMLQAIAEARATLPQFWKAYEERQRGDTDFSLKIKIEEKGEAEHIWLTDIEREGTQLFGKLGNDPESLKSVKFGDRLKIDEANISDWLYLRNGKIVGNRTIRPLFSRMSPEEVESYKKMLADP